MLSMAAQFDGWLVEYSVMGLVVLGFWLLVISVADENIANDRLEEENTEGTKDE